MLERIVRVGDVRRNRVRIITEGNSIRILVLSFIQPLQTKHYIRRASPPPPIIHIVLSLLH